MTQRVDHGLEGVSSTLLIPLVARAMAHDAWPALGLDDPFARALLDRLHIASWKYQIDRIALFGTASRACGSFAKPSCTSGEPLL